MGLGHLSFLRDWKNPADFPTVEPDEATVRADLQYHPDAIKDYINGTLIPSHDALTDAKHSHNNKTVLDGITADDVAKWRGTIGTFRINVTYSNGVYSADKTFDEIKAAYDAGQQPYVVLTGGTLDLVYTLASFSAPDGTGQDFVDFERYLIQGDTLETETLRIYSYITDSGSNVVKRIDEFKMPTSLKNPNALTFTGGATGSYDGSEPETVHIPVIPYEVINKNTAARHSHDNKTVLDSITADDVAKLAQEPLDGTTLTLTPTQVYDAVSVGTPVKVQYFDGTYGSLSFTVFNVVSQNMIVSQRIVYAKDEYILAELRGNKPNGTWNFVTTTLAEKTDIPSLEGYATEAYVQNYHDNTKQDIITDLATIRSGASKGATAVQPEAGKGLFSGSYNDLTDKPTIPDISGKQDKLIAGEGITIAADGKTISSSGATVFQTKSITDSGGHFTSDTVEGALQEIGAELAGINTLLGSGIQISFTINIPEESEVNTFSAVSGATWKEWVGTGRPISTISGLTLYCFSDDGIVFGDEAGVYALALDGTWVHGNDTIISGAAYTIDHYGG